MRISETLLAIWRDRSLVAYSALMALAYLGVLSLVACPADAAPPYAWAIPAKTPGIDVACSGCLGTADGKLTPGYPTTIRTFSGRYLDSQATNDFQQPFRTARAGHVLVTPNRIYMVIGSSIAAYDPATFFARVAAGEPLNYAASGPGRYDRFLGPDSSFYAENPSSGWYAPIIDGQERLYGFDVDDRGYVYLAYSVFSWGIVKDDPVSGQMVSQFQDTDRFSDTPHYPDDVLPLLIASLRSSDGRYWTIVSGAATSSVVNVWDVTDRVHPIRYNSVALSMLGWAKNSDSRIAIVTNNGTLQIYTSDAIVSGGAPLAEFSASGVIKAVTSDGTNFWAASDTNGADLTLSLFAPSDTGVYTHVSDQHVGYGLTQALYVGGGYLTWIGFTSGISNLRVFAIRDSRTSEIDFGNYFQRYYTAGGGPGYARPNFTTFYDSVVVPWSRKPYLVVAAYGLGDVYELPTPAPPLTAGDANGDGRVDVADIFYLINFLFAGGPAPIGNGDANGDGIVSVADVFYLIHYLF